MQITMQSLSTRFFFATCGLSIYIAAAALECASAADQVKFPVGDEKNFSCVFVPEADAPKERTNPARLGKGVHLFVDDLLVDTSKGAVRRVNRPVRDPSIPNPVVTGGADGDGCTAPYISVVRDERTGKFRIWYNVLSKGHTGGFALMTSNDGVHWDRPFKLLADPGRLSGVAQSSTGAAVTLRHRSDSSWRGGPTGE